MQIEKKEFFCPVVNRRVVITIAWTEVKVLGFPGVFERVVNEITCEQGQKCGANRNSCQWAVPSGSNDYPKVWDYVNGKLPLDPEPVGPKSTAQSGD